MERNADCVCHAEAFSKRLSFTPNEDFSWFATVVWLSLFIPEGRCQWDFSGDQGITALTPSCLLRLARRSHSCQAVLGCGLVIHPGTFQPLA